MRSPPPPDKPSLFQEKCPHSSDPIVWLWLVQCFFHGRRFPCRRHVVCVCAFSTAGVHRRHGRCRAPSHRQKADRRILSCSGHTYCKGLLAVLDVRCWPDSGNAGEAGSVPLSSGQGRLRTFVRPVLLPTCSCHPGRALCPGRVRRQQFLRLPDRSGAGLIRSLNNVKTVIISSSGLASFRKTPYLCTRTLRNNLLW